MTAIDKAYVNLTVGLVIVIADIGFDGAGLGALTGGFPDDAAQSVILTVDPVLPTRIFWNLS